MPLPRPWMLFVLAAVVPAVLAAAKLNLDLWQDELGTVDYFVAGGPWRIVTDYSAPNNHILYSLILWPFHVVSDATVVLRLPSLIFTLGSLWMVFRVASRLGGITAGPMAAIVLGMTQMFLVHTMQVRGYGLSMFLCIWLADLALAERWTSARAVTIVLVGAAFLYVMPSNLLFLAPLAAVALAWRGARGGPWRGVAAEATSWCAAGVLAALCYWPVAREVAAVGRPWPPGWRPDLAAMVEATFIARRVARAAVMDFGLVMPLLPIGLICWAARLPCRAEDPDRPARFSVEPGTRMALPLVLALTVTGGAVGLTGLLKVGPFTRTYCPLLPLWAIAAGWLLAELFDAARAWLAPGGPASLAAAAGMVLVAAAVLPSIASYPERLVAVRDKPFARADGYYNYYAARYHPRALVARLSQQMAGEPASVACYADEFNGNLAGYFRRGGFVPFRAFPSAPGRTRVAVYVMGSAWVNQSAIARVLGLDTEEVRAFPLVADVGYYRLYRSTGFVEITPPSRAREVFCWTAAPPGGSGEARTG